MLLYSHNATVSFSSFIINIMNNYICILKNILI